MTTNGIKDETIHLLLAFFSLAFIFLIGLAIYFYPEPFDFFTTFLSDLGRAVAEGGAVNPISSILFSIAMVFGAGTLFVFFLFSPRLLSHVSTTLAYNNKLRFGQYAGLLSCLGLLGISIFRLDLQPTYHYASGLLFFIPIGIAAILFSWYFWDARWSHYDWFGKVLIELVAGAFISVIFLLINDNDITHTIGLVLVVLVSLDLLFNALLLLIYAKITKKVIQHSLLKKYVDFVMMVLSFYIVAMFVILSVYTIFIWDFVPVTEMVLVFGVLGWIIALNLRLAIEGLQTPN